MDDMSKPSGFIEILLSAFFFRSFFVRVKNEPKILMNQIFKQALKG